MSIKKPWVSPSTHKSTLDSTPKNNKSLPIILSITALLWIWLSQAMPANVFANGCQDQEKSKYSVRQIINAFLKTGLSVGVDLYHLDWRNLHWYATWDIYSIQMIDKEWHWTSARRNNRKLIWYTNEELIVVILDDIEYWNDKWFTRWEISSEDKKKWKNYCFPIK